MKYTFSVAVLILATLPITSLKAGHGPHAHALVHLAPLAVAVASSVPAMATTVVDSFGQQIKREFLVEEPGESLRLDDYLDLALQKVQFDWQKSQGHIVSGCSEVAQTDKYTQQLIKRLNAREKSPADIDAASRRIHTYCPLEGESITSYIDRARKFDPQKIKNASLLLTDDLLHDSFWDMKWEIQRHVLAMNIDIGLLSSNATLAVSQLTPLDHAAQQKDAELIFFLWEHGARKANHPDTRGYVRMDVMMRSSDARSVAILKEMISGDANEYRPNNPLEWLTYEWATHLDPAIVTEKMHILSHAKMRGKLLRPGMCVPYALWDSVRFRYTSGAQTLSNFAGYNADWRQCKKTETNSYCSVQ